MALEVDEERLLDQKAFRKYASLSAIAEPFPSCGAAYL
jgi:hypothetical protein